VLHGEQTRALSILGQSEPLILMPAYRVHPLA